MTLPQDAQAAEATATDIAVRWVFSPYQVANCAADIEAFAAVAVKVEREKIIATLKERVDRCRALGRHDHVMHTEAIIDVILAAELEKA